MAAANTMYRALRARLRPVRAAARTVSGAALAAWTEFRWTRRSKAALHKLPAPLIISLTSHPPRFRTLALTLKCLLTQSVAPDRVVLWLTEEEQRQLPRAIRRLPGLSIETAPPIRSFKKIIPALARYGGAFIAIADDDVFYPHTWLEELLAGYDPERKEAPCHRAYRMAFDRGSTPAPYATWRLLDAPDAGEDVFPTGVGGVLYPPNALDPEARDAASFMALCPTSDDAWLYWMTRRAGWRFKKIGHRQHFTCWPGSQTVALQHDNAGAAARNDAQIAALVAHFGFPPAHPPSLSARPASSAPREVG